MHCGGAGDHRIDDVLVAGAAADVAFEPVADLRFAQHRPVGSECDGGHQHPRGAESALQAMMFAKRLLHRMQPVRSLRPLQALDRDKRDAVEHRRQQRAALHRCAVDMHHAGAALAGVAANMGAGEAEMLAQQFGHQRGRFDIDGGRLAVQGEGNLHDMNLRKET